MHRLACAAFLVLFGGCDEGAPLWLCFPACPQGSHCEEGAICWPDPPPDLRFVGTPTRPRDLALTRPPGDLSGCFCPFQAPYCNAQNQCVPCLNDNHCPVGKRCARVGSTASCVPGCSDDSRCGGGPNLCCDGLCADVRSALAHCGVCNHACKAIPHTTIACKHGLCETSSCHERWGDCNGDAADGCETNLQSDSQNCGACGTRCNLPHAVGACANSCYVMACDTGYQDCNSAAHDGCETEVRADSRNCGGCGRACPIGQACFNGICV